MALLLMSLSFSQTRKVGRLKVTKTPTASSTDEILAIQPNGLLVNTNIQIGNIGNNDYLNAVTESGDILTFSVQNQPNPTFDIGAYLNTKNYATVPQIPTNTSDLLNDGDDGISQYTKISGSNHYIQYNLGGNLASTSDFTFQASDGIFNIYGTATGVHSKNLGRFGNSIGLGSINLGYSGTSSGAFSTNIGHVGISSGQGSFNAANESEAPSFQETVLGLYATNYTPNQIATYDANDRLFNIGNGINSISRSDAFTLLKNGNVGIGYDQFQSVDTGQRLQVFGSIKASGFEIPSGGSASQALTSNGGTYDLPENLDPLISPLSSIVFNNYADETDFSSASSTICSFKNYNDGTNAGNFLLINKGASGSITIFNVSKGFKNMIVYYGGGNLDYWRLQEDANLTNPTYYVYRIIGVDNLPTTDTSVNRQLFSIGTEARVSYKSYTALLSQSGTNAPTATILENTLNGNLSFFRNSAGVYNITSSSQFVLDKTAIFINSVPNASQDNFASASRINDNVIELKTQASGGSGLDDVLNNTSIEIRVYN